MQLKFLSIFVKLGFGVLLVSSKLFAFAQPAGLLYDPEPPIDSAYVRVIHAAREGMVDVVVDGRIRLKKLAYAESSEYMVLAGGKHTIAIHASGKPTPYFSTVFEVVKGRAVSLVFTTFRVGTEPIFFEDKANTNKLKALLSVYNLDSKVGPVDILTTDGATKVFEGLAYATSASLLVNPIAIDLIAAKIGDKVPQGRMSLAMTQGGTYSVLLLPGDSGKLIVRTALNKIERYTTK